MVQRARRQYAKGSATYSYTGYWLLFVSNKPSMINSCITHLGTCSKFNSRIDSKRHGHAKIARVFFYTLQETFHLEERQLFCSAKLIISKLVNVVTRIIGQHHRYAKKGRKREQEKGEKRKPRTKALRELSKSYLLISKPRANYLTETIGLQMSHVSLSFQMFSLYGRILSSQSSLLKLTFRKYPAIHTRYS